MEYRNIKEFFIKVFYFKMRNLARLTIWRYEPRIIGITGSVGKTSTKLAIAAVLAKNYKVGYFSGDLDNELCFLLSILGDRSTEERALMRYDGLDNFIRFQRAMLWFKVMMGSAWRIIKKDEHYPNVLILEYGTNHPGNIKNLLKIARPEISIITAIGDLPVHAEFFAGPEEFAREKGRLIECLSVAGYSILNGDDDSVMRLKSRTRARVMTFGFLKENDIRVTRFENTVENDIPVGVSFKLEHQRAFVPVRIKGSLGMGQAYAAAAAGAIGIIFGMNLVTISEALGDYIPAKSRMRLVPGIKGSYIIDDCYNANPLSMRAALDTLQELQAKRKVAILGDMLEIGKYTPEAHEYIGDCAAEFLDVLVTVGARAKFIADAAKSGRMKKKPILSFDTADDARKSVQNLIQKGDLILVKGSRLMALEKIVEEIKE